MRPHHKPSAGPIRLLATLLGVGALVLLVCGSGSAGPPAPSPVTTAGVWRWPLDGTPRVTRRFDPPDTPYGSGHRGVDLAGRPGEVVRAAGSGRIGYAGVLAGRGVVTVLHPDGLKTTYEPVRASVHAGASVPIGAMLGRLEPGHAGCPVTACLHWGLLRGTTYLDPLALVGSGRVRLLPLSRESPG
jgi:murein DD-endopeptidase MepM/ murein hydrolase activator NlpD